MTPVLGSVSLSLAAGFGILSIILLSLYIRSDDYRFFLAGRRMAIIVSVLVIIATLVLVKELITSNFDVDYVAHYTSIETPTVYKFTALWAGQSGSLLFWIFILSIYSLITIFQNRNRYHRMMPWVLCVILTVQLFFLILTNFITNPFEPTNADFIVANGLGLNPLLQNLTMAIHPPVLYLGFVGFTIPFAFTVAALLTNEKGSLWVRSIRRWSLVTWLALSSGIMLGGWWAYQELGWGGYWAWDPVENASFMPWLTGTAFLHSIIIQEKKNMLRIWNAILIMLTFALTIFGTFLTRSGVMSSVHSFTESSLGPIFLAFVAIIVTVCAVLIFHVLPNLKSNKHIESLTSRESGFLFNNVVFVTMCFAVFWGTIFPVISEAVRGTKITVGPPFFNQVNVPIGLLLLMLTGVGPLLAWRRTSRSNFIKYFSIPIGLALIAAIVFLLSGFRGYVVISLMLSVFVVVAIVTEFKRGIQARVNRFGESSFVAFRTMVRKNRSRYGGYFVHLGIVLMFIGFTGQAFNLKKEFGLGINDREHLGNINFELKQLLEEERPNHFAWISELLVTGNDGNSITTLRPEKRIYFHRDSNPDRRQPHSELDIHSTLKRDIYSVFSSIDTDNDIAFFQIMINPLVQFVWYGGYILVLGTLVALWPSRREKLLT
jgi:cytochrome c-type biogenesis protein CcmF